MSNEKTRILCVITQSEMGGAQQFLAQLVRNLDHERFELIVAAGSDGHNQLKTKLPAGIRYLPLKHLRRRGGLIEDIRSITELRSVYQSVKPHIVFLNSSKAGFNGSAAARWPFPLTGFKVIYRIGGWTFNDPWPTWKRRFYAWLERISAPWKDIIVVNNAHDLEQAKLLGIKPRRSIMRIYNGIEPYGQFKEPSQARNELERRIAAARRSAPYDWLVGTIANFYPTKDLATLVRAAGRVSENVRFVVIGDGEQRQLLEKLIVELGLEKRFFLIGSVPDAAQYLPAFDIFVLPSVKEGFPWSVLEAMTAKVPVIATRVGAIPEMLQDHVSGLLVEPSKPEELAKAIVEAIGNERLRQDMAIQAHQRVIAQFSLREMISQYESLFSE